MKRSLSSHLHGCIKFVHENIHFQLFYVTVCGERNAKILYLSCNTRLDTVYIR